MEKFKKEADLCRAFLTQIPPEWAAYPEAAGFDIVLLRKKDGLQVGVEAKLKLNAKVILQAAEEQRAYSVCNSGPDMRAVLVPEQGTGELSGLLKYIGVTAIYCGSNRFHPHLPNADWPWDNDQWFEFGPAKRLDLPDYIPDVEAGHPSPVQLSTWKVGAIKLVITLEKRGYITRHDLKHCGLSASRWLCKWTGWLDKGAVRGQWVAGPNMPDFRAQHPVNFKQIEADYEVWKMPDNEDTTGILL